jgi:hypothetical protein
MPISKNITKNARWRKGKSEGMIFPFRLVPPDSPGFDHARPQAYFRVFSLDK